MRNYKIDILRGMSILLVLIHHFNIPYKLHDTFLGIPIGSENLSTLIARNGNYGVTMFFVISGFLITQHTLQRSGSLAQIKLKDFYIRRLARIMPCLVLLVTMVSVLGSLGLQPFINQSPNGVEVSYAVTVLSALSFWMNLLIIEYGWVNYALGVLWSLSVEEVFYLAFPVLCLGFGRGKGFIVFLFAVIAYAPYFRALHFGEESGAYLYHYFSSFDGIAIGCLTAMYAQHFKAAIYNPKVIVAVTVLLMTALYF
ncbi:MAG: acyltransferase, partial [Pseudomonadales bacterium]|nr:acyltransferase [Pseudomonadales bacterium]